MHIISSDLIRFFSGCTWMHLGCTDPPLSGKTFKKNSWASSMPGWDATNRRTTERCPPKAASCKARWPSSVLTGKFFWRLNSVKNSWKKCRVRLFRSYEHGERMRKGATFPLAFENVRSWPGQGHLLSQASPRWLLQAPGPNTSSDGYGGVLGSPRSSTNRWVTGVCCDMLWRVECPIVRVMMLAHWHCPRIYGFLFSLLLA